MSRLRLGLVTLAASLLAAGCGRSFGVDDLGTGGRDLAPAMVDAGPREVPDDGPRMTEPVLGPLELERSEPGRRLAARRWRLPDGTLEERIDERWFDLGLGVTCREVAGRLNESGRLHCMPSDVETDNGFVRPWADAACETPALPPRPGECTSDRLVTIIDNDGTTRVWRPSGVNASMIFDRFGESGECRPLSGLIDPPRLRAGRMLEEEMVGGDESLGLVGPFLAERTRRFDDGSSVIQRVTREPCVAIPFEGSERRCVPGFYFFSSFFIPAESAVAYRDDDCTEAVFPMLPDAWERIGGLGFNRGRIVLIRQDQTFAIRPVLSDPTPSEGTFFERDDDGMCRPQPGGPLSVIRLGPEVPLSDFPRLTLIDEGAGRLRRQHLVDDDGVAWPVDYPVRPYRDADLGFECSPTVTTEGSFCLPSVFAARPAVAPIGGSIFRPAFADPDCTERLAMASGPGGGRYLFMMEEVAPDACDVDGPPQFLPPTVVSAAHLLEPPTDDPIYVEMSDGSCAEPRGTPVPDRVFQRVGEELPLSTFAAVELVPN